MRGVAAIWHCIQHYFGWNLGEVETFWNDQGYLMTGFRCGCGTLSDAHRVTDSISSHYVRGRVRKETS